MSNTQLREHYLAEAHRLLDRAEVARTYYEDRTTGGEGFREALRNHERLVAQAHACATLAEALRETP